MTPHKTPFFAAAGISALLLAVGVLSGCTPDPEPTPTPTAAFASEEEAFAAAEEVYRAYTDAVNEERNGVNNADPSRYLVGAALDGSLETTNQLQAQGLHLVGDSRVQSFAGESAELDVRDASIVASVCLDVSNTALLDASDANVTPADRPAVVPLTIAFTHSESGLLISSSDLSEDPEC